MALVSVIDKVFNFDFSRKFEVIRPENVTYSKEIYPYTLREFIDKLRRGKFGRPTKIGVVFGTTRHKPADCKHPGYISDAMYIPEIVQKFQEISRTIVFKSFLDIDTSEEQLKKYNLILCGDGEVNCIVNRLLRLTADVVEIKYDESDKPFFMEKTSRIKHNMYGVVHVLKNPWDKDRFILHLGGIGPVGTISSLKWLCDRIDHPSLLPNSPFVVVRGEERKYPAEFDGYKGHCKYCCKVKEVINGKEKIYWRGMISDITTVVQIYPK